MQRNDRSYKDLKQKQKSAIADKTYKMHLKFYLENQRMPDATEMNDICKSLFTAVQSLAPKTEYEEFYKIVEKREKSYEERILRDIQNGIIIERKLLLGVYFAVWGCGVQLYILRTCP